MTTPCVDLRVLADARHWRWEYEESYRAERARNRGAEAVWLAEVPCERGIIYPHGADTLVAWTDAPRSLTKLLAIPGAVITQRGDLEAAVRFPLKSLDAVAAVMEPLESLEPVSWLEKAEGCPGRWASLKRTPPNPNKQGGAIR